MLKKILVSLIAAIISSLVMYLAYLASIRSEYSSLQFSIYQVLLGFLFFVIGVVLLILYGRNRYFNPYLTLVVVIFLVIDIVTIVWLSL